MPNIVQPRSIRLEFRSEGEVHTNLSGSVSQDDHLWVVGDEACSIERLQRQPPVGTETLRFVETASFALAELLDLPGEADEEADLEGMALADGWLWVVGSHGYKRKNTKPGRSDADNAKRLAKLSLDGNRLLLACLPVEHDAQGVPRLCAKSADGRVARRLEGDARGNALTQALRDDPHFAPYLKIPGKDNGFDIEGLAVLDNGHVLLGLRGPVLRGWAGLLEIAPVVDDRQLRLEPLDEAGTLVRKHFLQLGGLGVRDLHFSGEDLHVLAGPTMVLDGDIRVFRWDKARQTLLHNRQPVSFHGDLVLRADLPHGRGCDRAEAFCQLSDELGLSQPSWLVLYDAPGEGRRDGAFTVFGDLLQQG